MLQSDVWDYLSHGAIDRNAHCQQLVRLELAVLQRRLKMDQRRIRRFFGFLKWTKDEYEESSLIQKFFEDLRRYNDFQRKKNSP